MKTEGVYKVIKMLSWKAWVERPFGLIKERGRAQALKVSFAGLPNESRECFERANIYNRSKLLQDNLYCMRFFKTASSL
jgi:hypothetical protein